MITQNFDVNMIPGGDLIEVDISQDDTGEKRLVANLYAGDAEYVPSGTASIQGTREDGETFRHLADEVEGSSVSFSVWDDMTAAPGKARAQIVLEEGGNRTGSGVFFLNIQKGTT